MSPSLLPLFKESESFLPAPLSDLELERIDLFYATLRQWNETMNLVSKKSLENAFATHFVDSLWIANEILEHCRDLPLKDVGSGGGFPGILLAIRQPERPISLFEKATKKQGFLTAVISQLGLTQVKVDGFFDRQDVPIFASSRATIPVDEFFLFFKRNLPVGSRCNLCLGGERPLPQMPPDFQLVNRRKYSLPNGAGDRSIVIYERIHVPRGTK